MKEIKKFSYCFNGKTIEVEYGKLALQATSSILVKYGNSTVLSVVSLNNQESKLDFLPLTVIFQEKLYSVGKIPGGFFKREGKPSDYATLSARLIDRTIRPLFLKSFNHEVQVINNVFSVDQDVDVRIVALFASSLALNISCIPFSSPVAGVIIGRINDEFIVNPSSELLEKSSLELIVSGTKDSIIMIESSSKEINEELLLEAISLAHQEIKKIISFQEEIINSISQEKMSFIAFTLDEKILEDISKKYELKIIEALKITEKKLRQQTLNNILEEINNLAKLDINLSIQEQENYLKQLKASFQYIIKCNVRNLILNEKRRLDGRKNTDIRSLHSEIDVLSVVHGSALFSRGETQVLSIVTLAALGEHQIIDGLTEEDSKRFMHHYNFPAFSVGEVGRMGAPTRREVGHGALAEKALLQVLPNENEFPYTIRVVSEVLSSNGSSSQASICASSLALMAAGVPLKCNVAGIAMGLISEGDKYIILSDIQGSEDHFGDMDFKVSGTLKGFCSLQMDIKVSGIKIELLKEILLQAKKGIIHILQNMNLVISNARQQVSESAPKLRQFQIPVNRIRDIIGSGGKVINSIIENSNNVKIDISESGNLTIYHKNYESLDLAEKLIMDIIEPFPLGTIINGKIVRIEKFGYFINLKPGIDGLLHISKVDKKLLVLKLNQKVNVKVLEIDDKNRINLELISIN